jgi:MtN3 and saliva related transmembrane protein
MMAIDWIGWGASVILLLTIGRQVFTQWKTKSSAGVSKWLFVGQVTASTGFTIYSYLLHNWVFLCSNIALLGTAFLDGCIGGIENSPRLEQRRQPGAIRRSSRPCYGRVP